MIAEPDMAAIKHLRQLGRGMEKPVENVDELKRRLTSIEAFVAIVHRDLVGHFDRIDRVDARLEQIERCLEFSPHLAWLRVDIPTIQMPAFFQTRTGRKGG
jgi:hypothetical protein